MTKNKNRQTVSTEAIESAVERVMNDTKDLVGLPGEKGARARAVRIFYPALIRWLAAEIDLQTQPDAVAFAFSEAMAIVFSTILFNVSDEANFEQAKNFMVEHMVSLMGKLIKDTSVFDIIELQEAGQG